MNAEYTPDSDPNFGPDRASSDERDLLISRVIDGAASPEDCQTL